MPTVGRVDNQNFCHTGSWMLGDEWGVWVLLLDGTRLFLLSEF